MSVVVVDERYRIVLNRKLRQIVGVTKGDKLLAIPYKDGVLLLSLKGKRFAGSLKAFRYIEERHEASERLFPRK